MRLLTRQTLDHVEVSRELIEETRRVLDDRSLWRSLEWPGFGAGDGKAKNGVEKAA